MKMNDCLNILGVICAVTGTLANLGKKYWCFYFWGIANSLLFFRFLMIRDYPQVLLFGFYIVTCVYGFLSWKKL